MAAYESLVEYYLHQHNHIDHYLELCLNDADAELIHELRLSIKKLRAFNKLIRQLFVADSCEQVHINHRVTILYKLAGEIRDTQVQINLLASYEEQEGAEYEEFRNWLLKREKKRIERFNRKSHHVIPHATANIARNHTIKMLTPKNDETVIECSEKVLDGLFEKARKLSEGDINERNLHQIRIKTKQLRYILNIIQHCYPDFEFYKISIDSLREMEAAVGQWHDNLVRVEYLDRCIEKLKLTDNDELLIYGKLLDSFGSDLNTTYQETCYIVKKRLLESGI